MTKETNLYNFSQIKSFQLGHAAVIGLFQHPTSFKIIVYSFAFFAICITAFLTVGITSINTFLSIILSFCFYFGLKTVRAYRILSPFKIPLYGDFKNMILKTTIIDEMNDEDKKYFIQHIEKQLLAKSHLRNYNFITLNRKEGDEFLKTFISFDEAQNRVNFRLARENHQTP